jgi:SIR2-like protein
LDLATSRAGATRLVTTNFDLLFEECDPLLQCSGPPRLPDPRSDREFRGIVHLHGRVDPEYRRPQDDEFVVSSADFGRAYLTDGWAAQFIRSLLSRYQIVYVGYMADDPPVQYLLEALNLRAGSRSRLYAFQEGESGAAAALWEHKGVRAMPFDGANGFAALWDTLAAWAERARDVEGSHSNLLSRSAEGPAGLDHHVRGQIAHVVSTRVGSHRVLNAEPVLDGSWLLAFDPKQRYGKPELANPYDESSELFDPFAYSGFDFDAVPEPADPEDTSVQRAIFRDRKIPDRACASLDHGDGRRRRSARLVRSGCRRRSRRGRRRG